MRSVSVAFIGNIANNFYRELKNLQDIDGISAHLYMKDGAPNTERPESDEPSLVSGYPEWIRVYPGPKVKPIDRLLASVGIFFTARARNREVVSALDQYDVCVFSGPDMLLLPFVRGRKVFRATGSDLTVYPILSLRDYERLRPPKRGNGPLTRALHWVAYCGQRRLFRAAVSRSDFIDAATGRPFEDALKVLRVSSEKRLRPSRLCIDLGVFAKDEDAMSYCKDRWNIGHDSFLISIPSRMMMKARDVHIRTGQWKASDFALRGIAAFIQSLEPSERSRVVVAIPERTLSDDLSAAKDVILAVGLQPYVRFVKGAAEEGLTRSELIQLYSRSSAVLDDFGVGWYGSVVVEALACEAPVVTNVSEEFLGAGVPWHPLHLARDVEGICEQLAYLYRNLDKISEIGKRGRRWVQEFHSAASTRDHFLSTIVPIAKARPACEIAMLSVNDR